VVTAVCASSCTLLAISERALEDIAARWPTLWRALAALAYAYTRRTVRALAELIALPPRQRLAARLLLMAGGQDGARAPVVRLGQQAIGEMIGVTRKSINAYLAEFERARLLETRYNHIVLLDLPGLTRVAENQA
jgi:CRP/FNR family transcriptional regulator, cyclic AMP receptor protein